MPKYEYDCSRCGTFADFRPLAEYNLPVACPNCGKQSPRTVLNFPAMSSRRAGPTRDEAARFSATSGHAAGCRCCGGKSFKISRKEWTTKLL
jgi:putative FmdB family regulatory protein